jgi:polyisoprenyl-teichoic acid--peptidoglycan teichoic acid transferase
MQRAAKVFVGLFALAAVAMAVAWALTTFVIDADRNGDTPSPIETPTAVAGNAQPTLVIASYEEGRPGRADLVMLLAVSRTTGQGTIVLVPPNVLAEVPGEGLLRLGDTLRDGDASLLELSLANLLGLHLDGAASISDRGWATLFNRIGGLTLDVPTQLVEVGDDGERTVRFQPGVQQLDGQRVAAFLTFRQATESELQRLPRVQQVLEALLDRMAEEPDLADRLFDGDMLLAGADAAEARFILESLAAARANDLLEVRSLQVSSVGSGDQVSYRINEARVEAMIDERLAESRPSTAGEGGRRLQVLNGNGIPGVGQQVAERLRPGGFRLVESGNAASFDVPATRIIIYRDDPDQLRAAREVQELLGVGQIEVSEVPVSVVDITIIVGRDFP